MVDTSQSDPYSVPRQKMVEAQLRARGIRDERVLDAMLRVPRHEFIAEELRSQAYKDHPISIACGQTISQPYIVAIMLEDLRLQPWDVALEIGTGSGYLTAVMCRLVAHVYSIERHAELAETARGTLARLGCDNVAIAVGDGSMGWPEKAPFDAIIVSAAA